MQNSAQPVIVLLVALYRYQNFPIRILHALLENMAGVKPHTIFLKNSYTNAIKSLTSEEERLFIDKIIALNPKLVGFSVYSPFVSIAERMTKIVKGHSAALVLWGGIHPTLCPEASIKEADILCLGEGEDALADLVLRLRDGNDYRQIQNLWVKQDGHIHRNPMRPLIQDLDAIPFPAYGRSTFSFVDSNQLSCEDPALQDPTLAVMPARGCPFRCSFCVNSLLHPLYKGLGRYSRRRSVDNVIAELKYVLNQPGNKKEIVEFHDENFGTNESWLTEFEKRYPQEIGLPFKVQYNPALVKSTTVARLAKCGLKRLKFGIEAGTDDIRNRVFNRSGKNSEILKLAREIDRYGIKARYDLILDNPYDSVDSLKETLRLLLELPKPPRFNLYALQYFPDYPLSRRAVADGHISEEEAGLETLQKRMSRNWAFVPRFFPYTKKQALQNIIWLYASRLAASGAVRRAVFNDSPGAGLYLHFLNFKAFFFGKINAMQRLRYGRRHAE
jgi:anaerobic magnesium-protoporphyrin IX monomethyl ester cyclase